MLARLLAPTALLALALPAQAQLADPRILPGRLDRPWDPEFVDLDQDGDEDLVVASFDPLGSYDRFWILFFEADGRGGFDGPRILVSLQTSYSSNPLGFLVDDADGDGDLDLWVGQRRATRDVVLFSNDGALQFGETTRMLLPDNGVEDFARIDVDGDGWRDLVVLTEVSGAGYFPALSATTFGPFQRFFTTANGWHNQGPLAFGDLNGDGLVDILAGRSVSAQFPAARLELYLNPGSFPLEQTLHGTDLGSSADHVDLSDFDGDGDLDALAGPRGGSALDVFENDGGLLVFSATVGTTAGWLADNLVAADFDQDGDDDVIAVHSARLEWFENTGALVFARAQLVEPLFEEPLQATTDVTGNGWLDLLALDRRDALVLFTTTEAGGQVTLETPLRVLSEPAEESNLAAGDFDSDGLGDLVYVDRTSLGSNNPFNAYRLVWKRGRGDGSYAPAERIAALPIGTGGLSNQSVRLAAGDFDGDGRDDVLVCSGSWTSPTDELYRGRGDGTFAAPITSLAPADLPSRIRSADVDGDGREDVVLVEQSGATVRFAAGLAAGGFAPSQDIATGYATSSQPRVLPTPADLDGDGRVDFVIVLPHEQQVEVCLQSATGSFGPRTVVGDLSNLDWRDLHASTVLDVDDDGLVDIAIAQDGRVWWMRGLGAGAFAPPAQLFAFSNSLAGELAALHVDGDDAIDLVMLPGFDGGASLLWSRNLGGGSFGAFQGVTGGYVPHADALLPVDTDGDGDLDIVSTAYSRGPLIHTENRAHSPIGTSDCGPAVPNSSGASAVVTASGSLDPSEGRVTLRASSLPAGTFGIFLGSRTAGFVPSVPNSEGVLCLGGSIGRFVGPGLVRSSNTSGSYALALDLSALPTPNGHVPALVGESWHFQSWFRDLSSSGSATSNFTDSVRIDF